MQALTYMLHAVLAIKMTLTHTHIFDVHIHCVSKRQFTLFIFVIIQSIVDRY